MAKKNYDTRDLLASVVDSNSVDESNQIMANARDSVRAYRRARRRASWQISGSKSYKKKRASKMGGVIYSDSADKAARFVMDCNQTGLPIVFFPGRDRFHGRSRRQQSGIIRKRRKAGERSEQFSGAENHRGRRRIIRRRKLRHVRKAYDPRFIVAWPSGVMP